MQRRRYIFILLLFALLFVSGHASAQLDASALMRGQQNASRNNPLGGTQQTGGYGTNPYDTGENGEDQQGEPQDSTKKEKKPRKPLE